MAKQNKGKRQRVIGWPTLFIGFALVLGIISWLESIVDAFKEGRPLLAIILFFPMLLFVAWFLWITRRILSTRDRYRRQMENREERHSLRETLLFSLTWVKEIFGNIPKDRRPLVYNAYLFILLVLLVLVLNDLSMATVLLIMILILAATNLLVWVVGNERQDKDRMEVELETARKMQLSLMPANDYQQGHFEIYGHCLPSAQVGGDHFDYIHFGSRPDHLYLSVVDVSGKGMAAAVTAIFTSGAITSEMAHQDQLESAMNNINTSVCNRKQRHQFISLLLAKIDTTRRTLSFINAGQSRPLLLRGQEVAVLKGPGKPLPLGIRENSEYHLCEVELFPGDLILFHTDGVTDAVDEQGEMFGNERLHTLLKELVTPQISAQLLVAGLLDRLAQFSGLAQQFDDITLVALRVH